MPEVKTDNQAERTDQQRDATKDSHAPAPEQDAKDERIQIAPWMFEEGASYAGIRSSHR